MNEITSHPIKLKKHLRTKELLKIHQFAVLNDLNIYLYNEDAMASARNLPELLSFFLVNQHDELLLILEGPHATEVYPELLPLIDHAAMTA